MEIEVMNVGQGVQVKEITIVPIIRTSASCNNVNRGIVCSGSKSVVGIVAISPKWKVALNTTGEEVAMSQYLEKVPGLEELLQSR